MISTRRVGRLGTTAAMSGVVLGTNQDCGRRLRPGTDSSRHPAPVSAAGGVARITQRHKQRLRRYLAGLAAATDADDPPAPATQLPITLPGQAEQREHHARRVSGHAWPSARYHGAAQAVYLLVMGACTLAGGPHGGALVGLVAGQGRAALWGGPRGGWRGVPAGPDDIRRDRAVHQGRLPVCGLFRPGGYALGSGL